MLSRITPGRGRTGSGIVLTIGAVLVAYAVGFASWTILTRNPAAATPSPVQLAGLFSLLLALVVVMVTAMAMAMRRVRSRQSKSLKSEQKEKLLREVANSDDEIADIESNIKIATKRDRMSLIRFMIIYMAGAAPAYVGILFLLLSPVMNEMNSVFFNESAFPQENPSFAFPALIVGLCLMALSVIMQLLSRYRYNQAGAFNAALTAVCAVGPAVGTPIGSSERATLAASLARCAAAIRKFSPPLAFSLHSKIVKQQANHAGGVIQNLVYPAMLGDDQEIEAIGAGLHEVAREIGISNWMGIGKLTIATEDYGAIRVPRLRFSSIQYGPILLAALTAIPAIPVLISYLG